MNVQGYTAWSLMDNFEWTAGYAEKFGMYQVDFTNPARPRTAKDSARYFAQLTKDNGFVDHGTTTTTTTSGPGNGGTGTGRVTFSVMMVSMGIKMVFL